MCPIQCRTLAVLTAGHSSVTRELPNNIPYPAKRSLIRNFQQTWLPHTTACFDRVSFKSTLTELIRQQLSNWCRRRSAPSPVFCRTVNLAGGEVKKFARLEKRGKAALALDEEEARDNGCGVHDFPPNRADRYVTYPETVARHLVSVSRALGATRISLPYYNYYDNI